MEAKQKSKAQIISDCCCGILMICAIISYLIVGFVAKIWHPTWLILVCSALLCGVFGIIAETITNTQKLKEKNKTETTQTNPSEEN